MPGWPLTLYGDVYGTSRTIRSMSAPLSVPISGGGSDMVGVRSRSLVSHQAERRWE